MLALRSFAAASLQRHSLGSAAALPTQTRTRPDCRPARLRSSQPTEAQPRVWCCPARADTHTGRSPPCAASQQPAGGCAASGLTPPSRLRRVGRGQTPDSLGHPGRLLAACRTEKMPVRKPPPSSSSGVQQPSVFTQPVQGMVCCWGCSKNAKFHAVGHNSLETIQFRGTELDHFDKRCAPRFG